MLLNKNSFKIDGVNFGQYLTKIKYGRHKIWSSDTGRNNLSGKYTGTLVGNFPKFTLSFRRLTQAELDTVAPYLEKAQQTVTYYSPKTHSGKTISTYSGDYEYENSKSLDIAYKNEPFDISLIARVKE